MGKGFLGGNFALKFINTMTLDCGQDTSLILNQRLIKKHT